MSAGRGTRTGADAVEAVRGVLLAVPPAAVLSYGDVAELAGLGTPRAAGRAHHGPGPGR